MKAILYGIPNSIEARVVSVLDRLYGPGVIELEKPTLEELKYRLRFITSNDILVVVSEEGLSACKLEKENFDGKSKFFKYVNEEELRASLVKKYGKDVSWELDFEPDKKDIEDLSNVIMMKDNIIKNLKSRLHELYESDTILGKADVEDSKYIKIKNSYEELQKKYKDLNDRVNGGLEKVLKEKIGELDEKTKLLDYEKEKNRKILSKYDELNRKFSRTNKELEDMKSLSGNSSIELAKELASLRKEVLASTFNSLSNICETNIEIYLPPTEDMYCLKGFSSNIRFVFSGSSNGRKETYRMLRKRVSKKRTEGFILLDAVSETCIDYVFEIKKLESCKNLLEGDTSIEKYINKTCESNTSVMSLGVVGLNDLYFLNIDWVTVLEKLDNLGVNILIYCGDLSSIVPRVLFGWWSELDFPIDVYIDGSSVGSRSAVTNLSSLRKGGRSANLYFYSYTANSKPFYDRLSKTNTNICEIIS